MSESCPGPRSHGGVPHSLDDPGVSLHAQPAATARQLPWALVAALVAQQALARIIHESCEIRE